MSSLSKAPTSRASPTPHGRQSTLSPGPAQVTWELLSLLKLPRIYLPPICAHSRVMTCLFSLRSKRWPWTTPPIPSTRGAKLPAHTFIPLFSTFSIVTSEEMPCVTEGQFSHLRSEKHHLLLPLKLDVFIYPFCASYVISWAVAIGCKHSLISPTKKQSKTKKPSTLTLPTSGSSISLITSQ